MAEFDLCLSGGRVFVGGDLIDADLYAKEENIACLSSRGETRESTRVLDVSGKLVLPGTIDLHAHHAIRATRTKKISSPFRKRRPPGALLHGSIRPMSNRRRQRWRC